MTDAVEVTVPLDFLWVISDPRYLEVVCSMIVAGDSLTWIEPR